MSDVLSSSTAIDGFRGEQLRPDDSNYDEARVLWNGLFDHRPALIARCTCVEDVVAAVNWGRASGLPVAVRSGGHSAAGHSSCDDGLVIDLTQMKGTEIDPATRTIRAQPGLTWGEFDTATQAHGLAVTGGRFSTTGIAGLILGSGSGWLERRCGLTADNLLSAEVVTADGRVVRASEDENDDLFFGLRGGGGNFGIVTEFELRLHEIGPIVYGGLMISSPDRAPAILEFMRDYMADAPEDLGAAVAFLTAPPEPFVPAELHFTPVVGVVVCWTGSPEEAEAVVAPIREVAEPLIDVVDSMPYVALQTMLDGSGPYGIRAYMKAEFINELTAESMATLVEHGASRPGPMVQLLLEPLGGAVSKIDEDATALGRRDVAWCYHALAMWMERDPATEQTHRAWAGHLQTAMKPHTREGMYLNFTSDEGDERVRSTYGHQKYERLVAVKDKYDPDNLFHLNHNIRPSSHSLKSSA